MLDSKNVAIKGSSLFCTGLVSQGTSTCLCVAIKRTILVYELNRSKLRHRMMKEILCPGQVQCIKVINERLFVGYPSTYSIYSLQGEGPPIGKSYIYPLSPPPPLDVSLLGYQVQTVPQFLYPVPVVVHFYECKPITWSGIRITTLTFGNDDKSHQNKSHNEITVQLCAKVT